MAVETSTGSSTPLSSTATLSVPPSPGLKTIPTDLRNTASGNPLVAASTIVEFVSSRSSSNVFVYDLAEQVGFGTHTKSWAGSGQGMAMAPTVSLQTRAGAGLSLVGRLSQGTSKDAAKPSVLTAYTTPTGLSAMVQSLSYLPTPTAESRLIIQVPTVTAVGESFTLSPTLAPFTPALSILPETFTILLSATAQEAVDLASLTYQLKDTHSIHFFDHHSATREIGTSVSPSLFSTVQSVSLKDGLALIGYDYFDYAGDNDAETVLVLLNGPLASAAKSFVNHVRGLGVVSVRVLRPWNEDALRKVIPSSAKRVHVFDDVPSDLTQGHLYVDVFSALLDSPNPTPVVKAHRVTPSRTQTFLTSPASFLQYLRELAPSLPAKLFDSPNQKKLLFFSTPSSYLSALPRVAEQIFLAHSSIASRLLTEHDVLSRSVGVTADRILLASKGGDNTIPTVAFAIPLNQAESDFVTVTDEALLKSHSVLDYAKAGSPVLITTSWTPEELATNLPASVTALVRERGLHLYAINTEEVAARIAGATGPQRDTVAVVIALLAFLRLYLGKAASEATVLKLAQRSVGENVHGFDLAKIGARAWGGLVEVEVPVVEANAAQGSPLKNFEFNAIAVETEDGDTVVNGARLGSWHDAAKHILFPSAFTPADATVLSSYDQNPALRPELPERTFLITTTVNRRLTPLDYDRNVFHVEFDTSGTGLKYDIGEALGVHGWNDEQDVLDFCQWYGVDPTRLIAIPIPGTDGTRMHTRTIFQALQQQIDLFGKPGKSFYTDIAPYATSLVDQYALLFIGSPEGSSTFKKLSEKDTVTFADVLRMYPSARPPIEILCELVGDIKPRHYSIASSQAVVGDRVDLLVVAVDWVTPSGSPRFGQCTRYLAGLKVGQKVTVSIKPSVMKLPPDNMQPLILAGLGTGAAPFRAFLQYRAWQAAQGIPVGPVSYYFGSRHRSQEYLYGEEIEAFIYDGIITKAGLAFSRDQKKKVYIQNKMREDGQELARMLLRENGVFYLCGPTWPVPDVYEALVAALTEYEGMESSAAGAYLEGLKEEERYVLEVY